MPKRSRKTAKKSSARDENQSAFDAVQRFIERSEHAPLTADGKDPLAVALGRRGGLKGGKARADKLTPEQRRRSALKAARARWKGHEKPEK